ncbi:hypothetical protein LAh9_105 [Aeromonas phage LAh_9]|uniref:Uncharacterized protein n=1 Tax=Aeromonas phage LAh_9 TaxID=2591033 RepID=A0A514A134_9CAUD|nr:hypothetical protein HWC32_gp106 [Aeromonas phage LAh_9]QDH46989.1 hypothetical protein LAh9_105 [Aeromonas phage LAh_9]
MMQYIRPKIPILLRLNLIRKGLSTSYSPILVPSFIGIRYLPVTEEYRVRCPVEPPI